MDFARVEEEFERLKADFNEGALTEADFKAQLEELMIEDKQGRWWIIGYETGRWYVHDGEKWVQQQPPPPKDLHPAPPDVHEMERPLSDAWAKVRKRLSVPSDLLLIASSTPIVTFALNYALADSLYGRYDSPDWVHLVCAAAMPAVLPVALVLLRAFPGVLARSLVFVGAVMSLYWIGAPLVLLGYGGMSGGGEEIWMPSVVVFAASAILAAIYNIFAYVRTKRRSGRSPN